ncbi:hypothetical protein DID88_001077 [Monilinia fructigena]|uniref:Uncharacterized protein n=1 Tax=Monilinia fructigena TaxID=38457 RepID=A0A395IZC3_9HELO|nr:hypothetical protein DID88_001077 [Monilinia fructigena]
MDSTTIPRHSAGSTPSSSPGLFSPSNLHRQSIPVFDYGTPHSSPYLHPLQMHKVRETHKAQVEQDFITGRKLSTNMRLSMRLGEVYMEKLNWPGAWKPKVMSPSRSYKDSQRKEDWEG